MKKGGFSHTSGTYTHWWGGGGGFKALLGTSHTGRVL